MADERDHGERSKGDGYAVANLATSARARDSARSARGSGVTAFGVNAIVLPPSYETGSHYHDEQEELYFLHSGQVEIEFGDGTTHELEPGGLARVDASTVRKLRNLSDTRGRGLRRRRRQGRLRRPRRPCSRGRDPTRHDGPAGGRLRRSEVLVDPGHRRRGAPCRPPRSGGLRPPRASARGSRRRRGSRRSTRGRTRPTGSRSRIFFIAARDSSPITRLPRVMSPYSAVLEIE